MHVLYRPERLPVQGMQKRFSMDRGISTAVTLRFSQKILGALKKANGITEGNYSFCSYLEMASGIMICLPRKCVFCKPSKNIQCQLDVPYRNVLVNYHTLKDCSLLLASLMPVDMDSSSHNDWLFDIPLPGGRRLFILPFGHRSTAWFKQKA